MFIRFKKYFHTSLLRNKGSALIMVLMAAVAISAISLVFIQRSKMHRLVSTKQKIDRDLEMITAMIQSIMSSPASCNANFHNAVLASTPGSLSVVNGCFGTTCHGGADRFPMITKMSPGAAWSDPADYAATLAASNNSTANIRTVKLDYYIANAGDQQTGWNNPAFLTLDVTFEIKLSPETAVKTLPKRTFKFPVVLSAWNTSTATILGCPKDPKSIVVY